MKFDLPGSIAECDRRLTYYDRILKTSTSVDRVKRAMRSIKRLEIERARLSRLPQEPQIPR